MKNKRQIQKEETRKKIIEAAYRVYSKSGFNARTDIIAKEAGIAHGSIFSHFPTVDDLIESLIDEFDIKEPKDIIMYRINKIKNLIKRFKND